MKTNARKYFWLLTAAVILMMVTACDLALGTMVNTSKPDVSKSGDQRFLQGPDNIVWFDVTQEMGFGIASVTFEVKYNDKVTGQEKTLTVPGYYDSTVDKWYVTIDVTNMEDGQINPWVTAVDVTGNKTINKDILLIVKNLPPQIQMTIPGIRDHEFDDEFFMKGVPANDPVFIGFDLMGLATDDYGIPLGWPKIMIWPSTDPVDSSGVPVNPKWGVWRSMEVPVAKDGITTTRITWPMLQLIADVSEPGGYRLPKPGEPRMYLTNGHYRFRIWTRDMFGNDNFYPNRTDNTLGLDPDDPAYPVKYIEIDYMVSEIPIVRINDIRRYYNGVGGFTATVTVTSTNPLEKVEVFLADTDSGMSTASSRLNIPVSDRLEEDPYAVEYNPASSTYTFKLAFTDAEMKTLFTPWPAPIGSGDLYFHATAEDVSHKTSPQASREFTYDTAAPAVKFRRPFNIESLASSFSGDYTETGTHYEIYRPSASPKWVTGTVTVEGWSEDPANGIPSSGVEKIYYHIGNLFDDTTGQNHAGRQIIYENPANWTDTELDNPYSHADGWSGNLGTWSYTANFNSFKVTWPSLVQNAEDFGFYDSNGLQDVSVDITGTVGRQRFYLPFYVKIADRAGNIKIIHYKLAIDPDMDIPLVDINYPREYTPDEGPVGGEVRLSGIATDNEWVHTVLIRIHRADRPAGTYYIPASYGLDPFYSRPESAGFPKPRNAANTADDTAGWFEAYKIGNDMVVGWYYNINGDNGLDPDPPDSSVDVTIEVRAIDSKDGECANDGRSLIGPAEVVHVKFSAGVPTISLPVISGSTGERDYFDGIKTSGTMKVSMVLREDHNAAFGSIKIRFNGSPWTEIVGNNNTILTSSLLPGWKVTGPFNDGVDSARQTCFRVELDVDTLKYASYGNTSILKIDIAAADNSTPPLAVSGSYTFEIDNYYPTAVITTQPIASGTGFVISGEAKDYNRDNMIQGLERMLVYFEEAKIVYSGPGATGTRTVVGTGVFRNPRNRPVGYYDSFYAGPPYTLPVNNITWGTSGIPSIASSVYPNVMDTAAAGWNPSDPAPNVPKFANFPVLKLVNKSSIPAVGGSIWESPHAMVIDSQEFGETTDSDLDGTYGEVWDGMVDKVWQARMNTTLFPDGPLMVHYIIMDQAGNATHYQKPIFIENKKPNILSINLGTDINRDGYVEPYTDNDHPGEFRNELTMVGHAQVHNSKIEYDPAFRVRNSRLSFIVNTEPGTGNNGKHYRVSYVTQGSSMSAAAMQMGGVYTINATGSTEWQKYGAPVSASGVTFVASGPGEGTGTVFPYTEAAIAAAGSFAGDSAVITISGFTGIPDSDKTGGVINLPNDRLFIIKVYDSTVTGVYTGAGTTPIAAPESDQLAHAVLVAMNIDNTDTLPPTITAAPFGQKYVLREREYSTDYPTFANDADKKLGPVSAYTENIVMEQIGSPPRPVRQGYVQYAAGALPADASGKIIFLGKAEDNQLIQNITVQIPGFNGGAAFTVASYAGGKLKSVRDSVTGLGAGADAWYFNIINDELSLDYGHAINWEFAWDSSEISNQVGANIDVTFRVNDFRAGSPAAGSDALRINIAPYISEIVTGLSGAYNVASAFNRSANGWYPVRENEILTIRGFNLGSSAITGVSINATNLAYNAANPPASGNFTVVSRNEIKANVGTAATSGELTVWVGSAVPASRTPSLNNSGRSAADYNMEPNNVNNNILKNDRKLYIWSTGYLVNESIITNPFMRIGNNSSRYISYGVYAATSGRLRVMRDNTYANSSVTNVGNVVETAQNRFLNTTIAVDSAGAWYAGASNMTSGTTYNFTLYSGGTSASARTISGGNDAAGTNKRRILAMNNNGNVNADRVKIPRIFAQNTTSSGTGASTDSNATRIFMSYFDGNSSDMPVVFRYGLVGGNDTFGGNIGYASSAARSETGGGSSTWGSFPNINYGGGTDSRGFRQIVADNSASSTRFKGGMYTAVGAFSNGRPVVAWYDDTNNKLVLSYGGSTTIPTLTTTIGSSTGTGANQYNPGTSSIITTATADWQANAIEIDSYKGTHVDMAVDSDNNVHLAYYDVLNGGLYYALIPPIGTGLSMRPSTAVQTVKVDTFLAVGMKLMINVRNENGRQVPYISYFHGSFTGTVNSIRVAWRKTYDGGLHAGTDDNDYFTGHWEVMTVPAGTAPVADEFVCNGVPDSGTFAAVSAQTSLTGGVSGASTLTAGYADLTDSVILGYMTRSFYEGAILKGKPSLK